MRMTSADGHWRVSVISRDGEQLLRVERDSPDVPAQRTGSSRCGTVQTADRWFLAGDVRTPAEVERWVPLAELAEA